MARIYRSKCLLCGRDLEPLDGGIQKHPEVDDCEVTYTDSWGVTIDVEIVDEGEDVSAPAHDGESIFLKLYPFVDECLSEIYADHGVPFLGGQSSGRGWSSFSVFQRCPYLWKKCYIERTKPLIAIESPGRAIGTLIHSFLALHYTGMMDESNPYRVLTPETLYDRIKLRANPEFVQEAWRVFTHYRLYYQNETKITPLAVEHDLRDPRTGESCRYDLIAYFEEAPSMGLLPGTYNVDHKSGSRFDHAFLEGWQNDGEIIGQNALWQKLGLDKRFGPLRGTIVNLLGKQKTPQFHRTFVASDSWRVQSHLRDLTRWEGLINLAKSTDSFPRSRGNCIGRYGMCDWYDHCASAE